MIDPYVYEGTNILKNKFDIRNAESLKETEADYIGAAITMLRMQNIKIKSMFDCQKIHKELFGDLYSWAGKFRTIDIYKGESILDGKSIDYVFAFYIKQAIEDLDKEFKTVNWKTLYEKEIIEKICYFISELWHIHPFREGNTRTTAILLYFLIKQNGLHVNYDFLANNSKYFRNALVLSSLYSSSKKEYLLGIVSDSITLKNISSKKYENIDGYEVNKYAYTDHTMKKLKTIKKPKDWKN